MASLQQSQATRCGIAPAVIVRDAEAVLWRIGGGASDVTHISMYDAPMITEHNAGLFGGRRLGGSKPLLDFTMDPVDLMGRRGGRTESRLSNWTDGGLWGDATHRITHRCNTSRVGAEAGAGTGTMDRGLGSGAGLVVGRRPDALSSNSKMKEAKGKPLVDTAALKALLCFLRLAQSLGKGLLQRLLLNLCAHSETRLLQLFLDMVAKALFDGQLLDVYFTRSFYKHILGVKNDISDILGLMFSMDADEEKHILYEKTEVTDFELISGGRDIQATEEYKHDIQSCRASLDNCDSTTNRIIHGGL